MKQYQKALLALNESGTPAAMQNKFAKIAIEAVDDTLKELANKVSKMYSKHIKYGWSRQVPAEKRATTPHNFDTWRVMQKAVNDELRTYVNERIAEETPEWQVIAMKNGWGPVPTAQ